MSDPFDAFDSAIQSEPVATATIENTNPLGGFDDPAAEFLAREKAEMEKIENNNQFSDDGFGDFGGGATTGQFNIAH